MGSRQGRIHSEGSGDRRPGGVLLPCVGAALSAIITSQPLKGFSRLRRTGGDQKLVPFF